MRERIRDDSCSMRLIQAQRAVEKAVANRATAVMECREAGATWELIGRALGVTKQAAQQRYG